MSDFRELTIIRDPYARPTGIRIEVSLDDALDIVEKFGWSDDFGRDLGRIVAEADDIIDELDRDEAFYSGLEEETS